MQLSSIYARKFGLIWALTLLLPSFASAQADYALGWDINETFGGSTYTSIQLDLDVGTNYFPINGGLRTSANYTTPVTGTCFYTSTDGLYCNMQADQYSINFVIESDLDGFIEVKDQNGFIVSTSSAFFNANI